MNPNASKIPTSIPALRAFRARHRLAVRDIADAYGCTGSAVSQWLNERKALRPQTLRRIRRAFRQVLREKQAAEEA